MAIPICKFYKRTMGNLEDLDAKVYMCLVMFYCLDNTDGEGEERDQCISMQMYWWKKVELCKIPLSHGFRDM